MSSTTRERTISASEEMRLLADGEQAIQFFRNHGVPATEFMWPGVILHDQANNGPASYLLAQQMERAVREETTLDADDASHWTALKLISAENALQNLLDVRSNHSPTSSAESEESSFLALLFGNPAQAIYFAFMKHRANDVTELGSSIKKSQLSLIKNQLEIWHERVVFACRLYGMSIANNTLSLILDPRDESAKNWGSLLFSVSSLQEFIQSNPEIIIPADELDLLSAIQETLQLGPLTTSRAAFQFIQHLPALEQVIQKYMGSEVSTEFFSWVHSIGNFSQHLMQFGIPIDLYGVGKAKTVDHLFKEVLTGECFLQVEGKTLARKVHSSNIHVYYVDEAGNRYVLKETKQVFSGGRPRERNLSWSLSEKLEPNEEPLAGAIRALREELQILTPQQLIQTVVEKNSLESPSYPGIETQYHATFYTVTLTADAVNPNGYQEVQPDKTTYYEWQLMDDEA